MRESRFNALLQQFNSVQPTSQTDDTNWSLIRLSGVEQIVEQILVGMIAEQVEIFQDKNHTSRLLVTTTLQTGQQE